MSVVTRFAPSPTGFLHIGGARTALFNYLFSKNKNGKFLLRIEDTDKKRSTQEAINAILEGLDWLGIKYDGEPILQSKNETRHKEVAQKLLESGNAYLCYTAAEELEEMRKKAEEKNEVFRFKSEWRNKTQSQSSTVKPVIRIKVPLQGEVVINDLIQGEIKVSNSELDDLVMLRSDGTPTYMFAVVVDDHDMDITHIIRGDDHLTNAFRQKIIYQALNWKVPEFAHIPLIYGSDGTKMSKRHGATSVTEYRDMGYLPEAIRNYLLRLGWSHGNEEIITDENAIKWFGLEKVGKSPARFDFTKLDSVNKHYIKQKPETELLKLIQEKDKFGGEFDHQLSEEEQIIILKALKIFKESTDSLDQLSSRLAPYRDIIYPFGKEERELFTLKKSLILEIRNILSDLPEWNHDQIKNSLNNYALSKGIKIKDFGPILRIALTFSSASSGGIFDVIEILGKEWALKRLDHVIEIH